MDKMVSFDAINFPADDRAPHLVQMMTSTAVTFPSPGQSSHSPLAPTARIPHPEMYMEFVLEAAGTQAWRSHVIEMLDGMNKKFANPYVIFYPVLSRDGMPFPVNKCLKEIQGPNYRENLAWRGNLIVAKYSDEQHLTFVDATMADFPLLKNYLSTHYPPPAFSVTPDVPQLSPPAPEASPPLRPAWSNPTWGVDP